ncbi:MAG: metallophosphoesterase [Owenweeksia sp.]|nr:metallophosphoesterase [Owenweeksia sp.]
MDLLVIGDVHGCYYTLKKLVKKHWRPGVEVLIQAGDLINKGPHSIKCIQYWMQLEKTHSGQVCLLRGNHEQLLLDCIQKPHEDNPCYEVWRALIRSDLNLPEVESWLDELPLKWENPQLLITHAGWAKGKKDP